MLFECSEQQNRRMQTKMIDNLLKINVYLLKIVSQLLIFRSILYFISQTFSMTFFCVSVSFLFWHFHYGNICDLNKFVIFTMEQPN